MSHEAVRALYHALARDQGFAARYNKLTWEFLLGYRPSKIVVFAEMAGHRFTVEELETFRLTNYVINPASWRHMAEPTFHGENDYTPTAHPHPPASVEEFRRVHGRDVDFEPKSNNVSEGERELGPHNRPK